MKQRGWLIDTDVLVDYLRGREEAAVWLENLSEPVYISAMSVAELCSGARPGREHQKLQQFIGAFEVVPVSAEVAQRGGLFRRDYGPSHGTGLGDALIAATAEVVGAQLVSLNERHFPMVKVEVPYRKLSR